MDIISFINDNLVWGTPMLGLMLFTGLFFTVKSGFFQIRRFPKVLRCTVFAKTDKSDKNGITPFRAMCQALASTLGTGNIAGVSTAVAIGGAGAVFWMWISAFFGMMTGFSENVLGILYRRKDKNGAWHGGAMYYIRDGLAENKRMKFLSKPLSVMFAALCMLAGFGMGNTAQMNSAAEALKISFGIPNLITGIILSGIAALIVFGGIKRISSFTAKLVPLMSGIYIIGSLYILIKNSGELPRVFSEIFSGAFGFSAIGGGLLGSAMKTAVSMGFKRGVFSNEAGLGTSVFAHCSANVKNPVQAGMWSIFEIFFDTIVMCTLTALVLLTSPCGLPSANEALISVSGEAQYFRLTDSGSIITDGNILPEEIHCTSIYGDELTVSTEGLSTYSNIMCIKGQYEDGHIISAEIEPLSGVGLAAMAFGSVFGKPAEAILSVLVAMFAFSTVIGWSYFGSEAGVFLAGEKIRKPFCIVFIAFSVIGAAVNMSFAWGISDMLNGLMAIPNLIAVLCLQKRVMREVYNDKQ